MATVYFQLNKGEYTGPIHVIIKNALGEVVKERDTSATTTYSQTVDDNNTYTFYFSAEGMKVTPSEVTLNVGTTSINYNKKIVVSKNTDGGEDGPADSGGETPPARHGNQIAPCEGYARGVFIS